MFQDGSRQETQCKTADSDGLVLRRNKINFTYLDNVCEIFDLDLKHGKPSKQTFLAVINKFLKTWSVLDVPHSVVDRKPGDQWLTLMQLDAILKSPKRSISRTHSEEIKSLQLFAERLKGVPLKDTSKTKDLKAAYNEREPPFVIEYNRISETPGSSDDERRSVNAFSLFLERNFRIDHDFCKWYSISCTKI